MHRDSSGQILLITLLVLTVGMTIALSLLQRQQKNLTISNDVEESARAFSAAEAGVEEALKTGSETGDNNPRALSDGSPMSYKTNVDRIGAGTAPYAFPQVTNQGDTETVWLVNHNNDGSLIETPTYTSSNLDVCWKGTSPALSVIVLYKKAGIYQTARTIFDPNNIRANGNHFNFAGATTTACNQNGVYRQQIQFNTFNPSVNPNVDTLIALRLRPLYADALLYVDTRGAALPSQGNLVESTGTTGTGVTRKIVVHQQYRSAPSIFDAAIFSQSNFSH